MNSNTLKKLSILSTTLALGIGAMGVHPAQGALMQYQFQVPIDSGNLTGNTYNGIFTFDNALLTNSGDESINVSQGLEVLFSFLGTDYTQADDGNASIDFSNGQLLGLNFVVSGTTTFSFSSAIPDVLPAGFTYSLINDAGGGKVEFQTVPESSPLMGLLAVGILGVVAIAKRKR